MFAVDNIHVLNKQSYVYHNFYPETGGNKFLRNVGKLLYDKSHIS
jgi:hypothetical protein